VLLASSTQKFGLSTLGGSTPSLAIGLKLAKGSFHICSSVGETSSSNLRRSSIPCIQSIDCRCAIFKATTSTINPLVSSISSGGQVLRMLYASRRWRCATLYSFFKLPSSLSFDPYYKTQIHMASKLCLLESTCARITGGALLKIQSYKLDPIAFWLVMLEIGCGTLVPIEAMRSLCLGASFVEISTFPPTIIDTSLTRASVAALVRIIQHPYDELRCQSYGTYLFSCCKEPALATLL